MRYPQFLPAGGTIGFPAPSFGCASEPYRTAFEAALARFGEMGFRTLEGPNARAALGVGISNTPENCAREFMEMYLDEASDCLISCGGGELMCEILPYLDLDNLAKAKPKWFMGYSDNTNLTLLLATHTDTASVYGPCAASFHMTTLHDSLRDALEILTGKRRTVKSYGLWEKESLRDEEHPLAPYHLTEKLDMHCFVGREPVQSVRFQGRLLGGCLDVLANLAGTRFDRVAEFSKRYREDGILWFLEACDLNVFAIRRAMWQLEEAGWFQYVKGFLIGRPANGEPLMNLDHIEAVLEVAGRKGVPVVTDVDLGHKPPMMPLVVGSVAEVVFVGSSHLTVEMKFV